MTKAEKMFDALDYERFAGSYFDIEYEVFYGKDDDCTIKFDLNAKTVIKTGGSDWDGRDYAAEITLNELKAIVAQTKEWGWIE